MKRFFILITALIIFAGMGKSAGNWKVHPSFHDNINHVIETPEYVYFTSEWKSASGMTDPKYNLFRYDKKGEELQSLSTDNILAYNTVQTIQYNPKKKYMVVVYTNYDIDLIYDNGNIVNIPTYMLTPMSVSKKVNGISVDKDNERLYLATDFGYVVINDKKGEIAESRNYGEKITSVARVGNKIALLRGNDLLVADEADVRSSLDDYELLDELNSPFMLSPVGTNKCLVFTYGGAPHKAYLLDSSRRATTLNYLFDDSYINIENNSEGVLASTTGGYRQFKSDGTSLGYGRHPDDKALTLGSYNLSDIWIAAKYKGLKDMKYRDGVWTMAKDYMYPNAPGPFYSSKIISHPSKGHLVAGYGQDHNFGYNYYTNSRIILSGYRSGEWKQYSPAITNPAQESVARGPNSISIDPTDNRYVYFTSRFGGILRLNLDDPEDVLHLSARSDEAATLPGFVDFMPVQYGTFEGTCSFSPINFDYYGNMWTSYADYENQQKPHLILYYWSSEDRKASRNANDVRLPQRVEIPGFLSNNLEEVLPLKTSGNRNKLIYANKGYDSALVLIDINGTPTDTRDDKIESITNFTDQDGNAVDVHYINSIYEDTATGYVWVGHDNGVFYFNPSDLAAGRKTVTRIKVSRNDGTNLADYLLNGVRVNNIITDGAGRKWFATNGGGIICTSSDGREILSEQNTSNSDIPSDIVYTFGYDGNSNSILLSTDEGIAEYFLNNIVTSDSESNDIKVYPNPVRPDYMGYVTIEGVIPGSIIKITDSAGNVVKELERPGGNEAKWDVTNSVFKRVNSGVYYIMASPPENSGANTVIGKVLVVN